MKGMFEGVRSRYLERRAAGQGAAEACEGGGVGEGKESGLSGGHVVGREGVDADVREDG